MATFKQCPECEQHHPPETLFCVNCGASMADVKAQSLYGSIEHYWEIPKYLQEASRWRRAHDEGASGSGLVWIGAMLASIPFFMDPGRPLVIGTYLAGVLIIASGFFRMRGSVRTLSRAGLLTNAAALAVLGMVTFRMISAPAAPLDTSNIETSSITVQTEQAGENAGALIAGETAMFRGNPAHTGELAGPGPAGQPALAWRFDAGGEIVSSAAARDGLIFFTGRRGDIYAVDAASGELRWQVHLGDYILGSSPALAGDLVIVSGGYALFGLDAQTGEEIWKLPIQYAAGSSPTVAGTLVIVASQDGRIYAIDAATGAQEWRYDTGSIVFGSPAVSNGIAFVGTDDGMIHAIALDSGFYIWRATLEGSVVASAAVADDRVIIATRGGPVYALQTENGKTIWEYNVSGRASVAISQGTVLIGGEDGGLHALSLEDGTPRWLFPTGAVFSSSPVVVGETVYIAGGLNLYAIDLETGAGQWRFSMTDVIDASPAVANGMLYLGSRDGFMYAIGGAD
ncbi:MAG: PQQ-binding-like beta-propeller repeat protein [Thermomicrobiales bacterium]|nr:PQQ-binding-like beta-propeller repeat protein [Thermomicrobiales bacterium]